jgi:glycosyltransferase involved in cell wall biosynthesis
VQVVRHANASALGPAVREAAPRAKLIFAPADLHFLREAREAAVLGEKPDPAQRAERRARELACVRDADATLLHSDHELKLLAAEVAPAKLHLLRWIVTPAPVGPGYAARQGMLFVGNFAHRPNVDAVRWYAHRIAPLLRRLRPGLVLHVVGADPPAEVVGLAAADLVVHGWVRDLPRVLAQVRVSVAPLRYGAGFKGKVATSLAQGVPVVGTPIAFEGTGLEDGDGVAVARQPADFARALVRVHDDAELWEVLSRRAVDRVEALYSAAAAAAAYRRLLATLELPFR